MNESQNLSTVLEKQSYTFKELTLEAQEMAIRARAAYWAKCLSVDDVPTDCNYYKAYRKCHEQGTPWLFVDYVSEYCREEIIKEIVNFEFNADGKRLK